MEDQNSYVIKVFGPLLPNPIQSKDRLISTRVSKLLTENSGEARLFREQLNKCLEFADRTGILDSDLKNRLTSPDDIKFESVFYELKVGILFEGKGLEIHWHPKGRDEKVLEFEAIDSEHRCTYFVEVKTLFDSAEDKKENEILGKLWTSIRNVKPPFPLSVNDYSHSTDFDSNDFEHWLREKISEFDISPASLSKEIVYSNKSGFKVNLNVVMPLQESDSTKSVNSSLFEEISNKEVVWPGKRFSNKIKSAVKQFDKTDVPCLVVICDESSNALFDEELLALLYGRRYSDPEFPFGENVGAVFSEKQDTRISAVGCYSWIIHENAIHEMFDIYYNPNAANKFLFPILKSIKTNFLEISNNYLDKNSSNIISK